MCCVIRAIAHLRKQWRFLFVLRRYLVQISSLAPNIPRFFVISLSPSTQIPWYCIKSGHDHFQFIMHCHSTIRHYIFWGTYLVIKYTTIYTSLCNSMEESSFGKADSCSAGQGIYDTIQNQTMHYRVHNFLHDPLLSQLNPVHILTSCLRLIFCIRPLLWNLKVRYRVHKSLPLYRTPNHLNSVHILMPYILIYALILSLHVRLDIRRTYSF
jgi:hypothetical protein